MSQAPLRVVLIDDEPAARRGAILLLNEDPEIQVVGEAGGCKEAIALIEREKPDIALLDIQMPGGDGFDVIAGLPVDHLPIIVFITAYDRHAVKAFEVSAVDYLLKPYDDKRFQGAIAKAKDMARGRSGRDVQAQLGQLLSSLKSMQLPVSDGPELSGDRVLIKTGGEILFLQSDEIDWIEAEGDYMKFHVAGKSYLMRETMARLEARLDARRFVRIHRSVIVNIDRVRKLAPSFAGDHTVVLRDGTNLRLSRSYHERLAGLLKLAL